MSNLGRLLATNGRLQKKEVSEALVDSDPATKEKAAVWLRSELATLRDAEKKGQHPVRRGKTLSRLDIADLAFTMLESARAPGDQLLSLLQELLNVDRHRKSLAASSHEQFDRAANWEAQSALQGAGCGVRELARRVSVSVSTASQWKKSPQYGKRVEFYKMAWKDSIGDYVKIIEGKYPDITEAHAFRLAMLVNARFDQMRPMMEYNPKETTELLAIVVYALRIEFKTPPITCRFLPTGKFSDLTPEDVEQQKTVVMAQIAKLVGDPIGTTD